MLSVQNMIEKIRGTVHDEQETGYTDEVLLGYINDGIRLLRRTILEIAPMLLAEKYDCVLPSGEHTISPTETIDNEISGTSETKDIRITQVIDIRADGHKLSITDIGDIRNMDKEGPPTSYYLLGFSKVEIYPTPTADTNISMLFVRDMELLTELQELSPFPMDIDDFLVEYVITRASLGNEFDMTQEQQVIGMVIRQVESYLYAHRQQHIKTKGYW